MKSILIALTLVALAGCTSPVVYKTKSIPVVLDDKHFDVPNTPKPPGTRQELKAMDSKQTITWQTEFILTLKGHIDILEKQIKSIQEAMHTSADKLKTPEVKNE